MDTPAENLTLSERLAWLRQAVFGPRGRAAMAKAVGVSPSTYNYYEKGRPAPADLLARASQVTGADLTWLLTGRGAPFPATPAEGSDIGLSPPSEKILGRFAALVGESPQAAAAAAALRGLLGQMDRAAPPSKDDWSPAPPAPAPDAIPVVGRTAAGILAAWETFFADEAEADVLEHLIAGAEGAAGRRREAGLQSADPQHDSALPADATAYLTQLAAPTADGLTEFLHLPGLGPQPRGTFALRVDGDSMAPRLRNGDLVVSRRDALPEPGQTAIVRVRSHIGVTVKLWRPEGDRIHLVPINEAYQVATHRRTDILWASRVLWVVRL